MHMKTKIVGCARCGDTHEALDFKAFTCARVKVGAAEYTEWAICPTTAEPVLLRREVVWPGYGESPVSKVLPIVRKLDAMLQSLYASSANHAPVGEDPDS